MTTPPDGYRCRFGTIWTLWVLGALGVTALVPVCGRALSNETARGQPATVLAAAGLALSAFVTVLLVAMFLPLSQLRFRAGSGVSGAIFGTCFERSSSAPSSIREVEELFSKQRNNTRLATADRLVPFSTPVGGAWACSLAHRFLLPFPRMYTHRLKGRVDNDRTWLAGTSLKTVQSVLAKSEEQLIGVPSSSYVTLGAWVATLAHGNTGAAFKQPLIRVSAQVLDKKTSITTMDNSAVLLDKFGASEERANQFVVLAVTLPEVVPRNQSLRRSCRLLRNADDAAWFLRRDTLMRALFVGRRASLGMTWTPLRPGDPTPSGAGLVDKLRVLALAGLGWGAPDLRDRDGMERVSDAVYHFPDTIQNIQNLVQVYMALVNAEFFTTLALTPQTLVTIVQQLQRTHAELGGRTEIRVHADTVYFDVAMRESRHNFAAYFATLRKLGVAMLAQHRGKHRRVREEFEKAGLELVEPRVVLRNLL